MLTRSDVPLTVHHVRVVPSCGDRSATFLVTFKCHVSRHELRAWMRTPNLIIKTDGEYSEAIVNLFIIRLYNDVGATSIYL